MNKFEIINTLIHVILRVANWLLLIKLQIYYFSSLLAAVSASFKFELLLEVSSDSNFLNSLFSFSFSSCNLELISFNSLITFALPNVKSLPRFKFSSIFLF